jgi:hypothetical protein
MSEANTPPPVEKTDKQKESNNELVISVLALRNLIGISGMLLVFMFKNNSIKEIGPPTQT